MAGQPNIVLFYADDLGWTDLSAQGSDYYESPRIDSLARDGMRFNRAYAGAANCAPSRACLMTGLYTPRHGVYTVGESDRGKSKDRKLIPINNQTVLDRKFPTLAGVLKGAGYSTCIAGKWHLSKDPKDYGFDVNFGGCEWGQPKSYFSPYHSRVLKDGPKGEHLPARLASEVSAWIKEKKDGPFFVYFPFYSVHTPIQAPDDLTAAFARKPPGKEHGSAKYAAMIKAMDSAVGKVLDTLDELELADDTIVIFTSDNGPYGDISSARPLRGSKGMFYEGGIREPLFIRWSGRVKPGGTSEVPVHQVDLLPTLASIANATPPALLDGQSLVPLFNGGSIEDRSLFWHFPAYLQGYKNNPGARSPSFRTTPCSVIMKGHWKLIEYFEDGATELYDLSRDPSEESDLSKSNAKQTKSLHQELIGWRKATNAPVPTQPNPDYEAR
jgi:arylsulfatase A-like enzyme